MQKTNLGGLRAPVGLSMLSMAAALALGAMSSPASATGLGGMSGPAAVTTPRVSADPRIVDLGVAASTDTKNITVTLAVRNQAALDAAVAAVSDPKNASFRKFITPAQFAATYGQTPAAVAQVVSFLQSKGLTITNVHANGLLVSAKGTNAQIAAAFGTTIHNYSLLGETYQAPATKAVIPTALTSVVAAVAGLNTHASLHTHTATVPNTGALAGDVKVPAITSPALVGVAGQYTVLDLAANYNVNGLYAKHLTGAGKTIGIATLATYQQSDVFTYWNALGLAVDPGRITDVSIDGGTGNVGADETTLDVEQSGGLAPGAKIRVYEAPNTDAGFIDVFATPIEENLVDVLSISWGSPEIANDPTELPTFHAMFEEAALQGIPIISAAGDAGAFDINRAYTYPQCTTQLTVDFPAADPIVLAAGGTTLPNTVQHLHGPVTVTTERAWGWDYLQNYIITNYGSDLYYASYYTVGGGGGVSVVYNLPAAQTGLAGVAKSAAAQSLLCAPAFVGAPGTQYVDLADLPAGFAGRNLPDLSLDADPYSGYLLYFNGAWSSEGGGTSFVAPQLNGILTLITSGLPGRIGSINPQLYAAFKTQGYSAGSPFKAITSGDNEYFKATATYNPATGLGSIDATALGTALGLQ
jgi:kumamolisin